jgi:hypothetical protein
MYGRLDRADFNGDGRDDILWRDANTGAVSNWLANPAGGWTINDANAYAVISGYWEILGVGDFNGDGRSDILWIGDQNETSNWLGTANGGFIVNDANAFAPSQSDKVVWDTGDFNGDGRDDILWLSTYDGQSLSVSHGTQLGGFIQNAAVSALPTGWFISSTGDFNGDGRSDILLQQSNTGQLTTWLSSSTGFVPNANSTAQVPNWQIVGVGDFNGDGRDDLLWRHPQGALSNWLANAAGGWSINDSNALIQVSTDWLVTSIGDYNADGRDDILWRNKDTGGLSNWLASANGGFTINDANAFSVVPLNWYTRSDWDPWDY